MRNKVFMGILMLTLLAVPQLSYADWGRDDHGRNDYYHWQNHPKWGVHVHYLPTGYNTVLVGRQRYYYYDGLYYTYVANGDYVLVSPPAGAYVAALPTAFAPVVIRGRTYYSNGGVYYMHTRHGYRVVREPRR